MALGVTAMQQGLRNRAVEYLESSLAASEDGDPLVRSLAFANIGWLLHSNNQLERARAALVEGARMALASGIDQTLAFCLEALAGVVMDLDCDLLRAARLLGFAEELRNVIGVPLWAKQRAILDATTERIRNQLGPEPFGDATAQGRLISRSQVLCEIVGSHPRNRRKGRLRTSSARMGVAELIAEGCTSKQIADRLVITETTADTHAAHIRTKLGLRSRAEIAAWVTQHGD